MKKHFVLGGLLFVFLCLFSSSAFAQADKTGMIARGGIEIPIYAAASVSIGNTGQSTDVGALFAVGPGLDLAFGYRWLYFGILIEQQIGVVMATDDSLPAKWKDGEPVIIKKGDPSFLGATYVLFEEYIPINPEWLITVGEGLGASYGSGKNKLYVTSTDAAFAFKGEIGLSYFLFKKHGLGINFEFAGSMAIDDGISMSWTYNPMITYTIVL